MLLKLCAADYASSVNMETSSYSSFLGRIALAAHVIPPIPTHFSVVCSVCHLSVLSVTFSIPA